MPPAEFSNTKVVQKKDTARARTTCVGQIATTAGGYGGEPEALQSAPRQTIDMAQDPALKAGFWITRRGITFGEWLEFLNDPETRESLKPECADLLPRGARAVYVKKGDDGRFVLTEDEPSAAVMGITWTDLKGPHRFLAWKNQRAEQRASRWRYDLPSVRGGSAPHEARTVEACRGDGGSTSGSACRAIGSPTSPTRWIRRRSPPTSRPSACATWGGGRFEWCRDNFVPDAEIYSLRGGAWGDANPLYFRSATRKDFAAANVHSSNGGRLVARPRP